MCLGVSMVSIVVEARETSSNRLEKPFLAYASTIFIRVFAVKVFFVRSRR
jgi:hypothetical protein